MHIYSQSIQIPRPRTRARTQTRPMQSLSPSPPPDFSPMRPGHAWGNMARGSAWQPRRSTKVVKSLHASASSKLPACEVKSFNQAIATFPQLDRQAGLSADGSDPSQSLEWPSYPEPGPRHATLRASLARSPKSLAASSSPAPRSIVKQRRNIQWVCMCNVALRATGVCCLVQNEQMIWTGMRNVAHGVGGDVPCPPCSTCFEGCTAAHP